MINQEDVIIVCPNCKVEFIDEFNDENQYKCPVCKTEFDNSEHEVP